MGDLLLSPELLPAGTTDNDSRTRLEKVTKRVDGGLDYVTEFKHNKDLQIKEVKDSKGNLTAYEYDGINMIWVAMLPR
jgi:hypothetical protein